MIALGWTFPVGKSVDIGGDGCLIHILSRQINADQDQDCAVYRRR